VNKPVTPAEILQQRAGTPASQATRVEQSRAVAEVQAAFTIAQARPRDIPKAVADIVEACKQKSVAENAFFKYSRGGSSVGGESIHLAREMARCWGNVMYSVSELDRDDAAGRSEMLAYALDLETNTRSQTTFIVPHVRDTKSGQKALIDVRDIYENNANMGARRLREQIFSILPKWLIERAVDECRATLERGASDKPLPVKIAEAIAAFADLGISQARIEAKLGPINSLTVVDIASLEISYRSIKRREISAEDEFPRVSLDETTEAARALLDKGKPAETVTVDNPTAAEGPDQSQMGDAFDGTMSDHPGRKVADLIIAAAGKLTSKVDLANLRALRGNDIDALPDELAAEVEQAFRLAESTAREGQK